MTTFYLICFVLGFSLTVMSALGAFTHLHIGHMHGGHGMGHGLGRGIGHAPGHVHASGTRGPGNAGASPVNGFTLAAFLCWFGGCGYLLTRAGALGGSVILLLAVLTGLAGGSLLFWFLARVLLPHERELTAADTATVGALGLVTAPIREGGTGEVHFSQNGARCFAPARSDTGAALPRGTEVVVLRYEQGIAYVSPWDELSGAPAMSPGSTLSNSVPDGKDQVL
jgi:membrane protein implicated in regulation of membrane protease activity